MNKTDQRLNEDRANRRAARGLFDQKLAQVKADYAARGLGPRIKAKAADQGKAALNQGLEVAKESKGIIAGVIAALLLWFWRNPLLALTKRLLRADQDSVQDQTDSAAEPVEE